MNKSKVWEWIKETANKIVDSTIGKAIAQVLESTGQNKLKDALQDLHDTDIDRYKAALQAGKLFAKELQPLAAKTATTIDDMILEDIAGVVAASAAKNGITL